MQLLAENPELSQRQLADKLGLSVGWINFCLNALLQVGLVKLENFRSAPDKRRYAYILTPAGLAEKAQITTRFLARKRAEYEALREEIERVERGLGNPSSPQEVQFK